MSGPPLDHDAARQHKPPVFSPRRKNGGTSTVHPPLFFLQRENGGHIYLKVPGLSLLKLSSKGTLSPAASRTPLAACISWTVPVTLVPWSTGFALTSNTVSSRTYWCCVG